MNLSFCIFSCPLRPLTLSLSPLFPMANSHFHRPSGRLTFPSVVTSSSYSAHGFGRADANFSSRLCLPCPVQISVQFKCFHQTDRHSLVYLQSSNPNPPKTSSDRSAPRMQIPQFRRPQRDLPSASAKADFNPTFLRFGPLIEIRSLRIRPSFLPFLPRLTRLLCYSLPRAVEHFSASSCDVICVLYCTVLQYSLVLYCTVSLFLFQAEKTNPSQ